MIRVELKLGEMVDFTLGFPRILSLVKVFSTNISFGYSVSRYFLPILAELSRLYAGKEKRGPPQPRSRCTMKDLGRETESNAV